MARQYGEAYEDGGVVHYPWTDDETGESGEDLETTAERDARNTQGGTPADTASITPTGAVTPGLGYNAAWEQNPQQVINDMLTATMNPQSGTPIQVSPNGAVYYPATGQTTAPQGITPGQPGPTGPGQGQPPFPVSVPGQGGNPPVPQGPPASFWNQQAETASQSIAESKAREAHTYWLIRTGDENLAFQKAKQAWTENASQRDYAEAQRQYNETLAQRKVEDENRTALGLFDTASRLRGPSNYFQYLRTLSGTPEGLLGVVNAAAGRYKLSGFGDYNPNQTTSPQSLGTMVSDFNAAPSLYGGAMDVASGLPQYGSQLDPANMRRMSPTQKALMFGAYEAQGKNPEDVEFQYLQSLPRYRMGGSGAGSVTQGSPY